MPTATTTASNVFADSGQTETISLNLGASTGTAPFTANLVNYTGGVLTQVGSNVIVKTIGGTNSITFTVHSPSNGNTFTYNYLVTDYGTTANYAFNAVSVTITVNAAFTTAPTLTPSNTALDSGQYVTLTASGAAGGTLPYAYTFYNTTSGGAVAISACTSLSTATCTFKTSSPQ